MIEKVLKCEVVGAGNMKEVMVWWVDGERLVRGKDVNGDVINE